jgi:hypothetical protein
VEEREGCTVILAPGLEVDKLRMMRILRRGLDRVALPSAFGECGLRMLMVSGECDGSIIVTQAGHEAVEWIHASLAWTDRMPDYDELCMLKDAVFGPGRYAYQVFPPVSQHVNIHEHALHLWGRADGGAMLPEFGRDGTI